MQKQKFISKKWFILLLIVLLLIPVVAHAESTSTLGQAAGIFEDLFKGLAAFLTTAYRLLQKLLWPVMLAIGGLLGNDLLFGHGMEERLLDVWYQVRNLVNIGFVIVLLVVALANVIGYGKDNFELKTVLPKIIIALILVNFSYMGMKLILDTTNVLAIAIFSLPASISEDLQSTEIVTKKTDDKKVVTYTVSDEQKPLEQKICKSMFGSTGTFEAATENIKDPAALKALHCKIEGGSYKFTEEGKKFFAQYSPRNASLILAIQLMNVVDIDKVTQAAAAEFDLQKLSFTLLFSTVFYLLYAIAYVVLFIVLLARLIVLWVIIALSPLIALGIAVPDLFKGISSGNFDIKEKFVNHAIVPIKIAIPMTIGYMMLDALKHVQSGQVANFFQLGTFDINTSGISDLQTMIVAFGAVGVVWVGVFSAAEGTIAEGMVNWIKGQVGNAGKMLTDTLKVLPIVPTGPGKPGKSIEATAEAWKQPLSQLRAKYGASTIPSNVNRPRLTESEANRVTTVIRAKAALGKDLSNVRAQKALAQKFELWRTKGTGAQQTFAKRVRKAARTTANLRKFQRGRLSGAPLKRIQTLGTAAAIAPTTRTTGGAPTNAPAVASAIEGTTKYGKTNGLVSTGLQTKIDAYNNAPKNRKKAAEKTLKEDPDYQNLAKAQNNSGAKGSIQGVKNAADNMKFLDKDAIKPDQSTALQTAVTNADTALKAAKVDEAGRKKMLKGMLTKIFGDAKYGTHVSADVKNLIE